MSVSQAASYSIHGFLTRLVPGGIASLSIYFMSGGELGGLTSASPIFVLGVVAAFYVMGEIIEYFRLRISPVPRYFGRVLYTSSKEPEFLTPLDTLYYHFFLRPKLWINDHTRITLSTDDLDYGSIFGDAGEDAWSHLREEYNLPSNYSDTKRLYKLFLGRLDKTLSMPAQRIQRSFIFFQNIKIASGLGIILAFLFIIYEPPRVGPGNLGPLAFILILSIVLGYAGTIFRRVDEEYVDTLMVEYFQEVNL